MLNFTCVEEANSLIVGKLPQAVDIHMTRIGEIKWYLTKLHTLYDNFMACHLRPLWKQQRKTTEERNKSSKDLLETHWARYPKMKRHEHFIYCLLRVWWNYLMSGNSPAMCWKHFSITKWFRPGTDITSFVLIKLDGSRCLWTLCKYLL